MSTELTDFFSENGHDAKDLDDAGEQVATMSMASIDEFMNSLDQDPPDFSFEKPTLKTRAERIGRLLKQIYTSEVRCRAWKKELENARGLQKIDAMVADIDILRAAALRAETAGLTPQVHESRSQTKRRRREESGEESEQTKYRRLEVDHAVLQRQLADRDDADNQRRRAALGSSTPPQLESPAASQHSDDEQMQTG